MNAKVIEISQMDIVGNVIPEAWYQNIVRETGKPYLQAIVILADILYWYRPVEIRDEYTGRVIEYAQKFKHDMLKRNYKELSEKFGCSKRDVTNAVIHLEKMGLIKRVFRTIGGIANVMFIDIYPEEIQKISDKIISKKPKKHKKDLISRVKKRCNYVCQRCGEAEELNSFHVHHIISRKIQKHARDENNLVLLCPECHVWVHSKLNTNKEYIDYVAEKK